MLCRTEAKLPRHAKAAVGGLDKCGTCKRVVELTAAVCEVIASQQNNGHCSGTRSVHASGRNLRGPLPCRSSSPFPRWVERGERPKPVALIACRSSVLNRQLVSVLSGLLVMCCGDQRTNACRHVVRALACGWISVVGCGKARL